MSNLRYSPIGTCYLHFFPGEAKLGSSGFLAEWIQKVAQSIFTTSKHLEVPYGIDVLNFFRFEKYATSTKKEFIKLIHIYIVLYVLVKKPLLIVLNVLLGKKYR